MSIKSISLQNSPNKFFLMNPSILNPMPEAANTVARSDDPSFSETLDYLLKPLVDALSKLCPDDDSFDFTDAFLPGPRIGRDRESLIEFNGRAGVQAFRAVATLLVASESQARINGEGFKRFWPMWTPIHFSFVKRRYGLGPLDLMYYIHCYPHPDDDFNEEDAKRQVSSLVSYLGDEKNLVDLTSEERIRLF